FTERGCLACHINAGTTREEKDKDGKVILPAVNSQAHFGPNLSQIAAKLGTSPGDKESARRWLVQWIMNPTFHSPRTYMPIPPLTLDEAAAVADWLLHQKPDWALPDVPTVDEGALASMARLYLEKTKTRAEVARILENHALPAEDVEHMRQQK